MSNDIERIDLFVSKDVVPPYSFLFADHFDIPLKIKDRFLYEREVLIMPEYKFGFCTIANNGKILYFGATKRETLENIVNNRQREILRLNGKYFSFFGWLTWSYSHFTIDSLLGMLTAIEYGINLEEYKIILPEIVPEYINEYLSLLTECGYKINFVKVPMDKNIVCEEMIFYAPDHLYSKQRAQCFGKFRDKILERYPISKEQIIPKIFLSRKDVSIRPVYNEDEVADELKKLGYAKILLTNYSIKEKIQLFSTVKEVVLPHGGGGLPLYYSLPGVKVVDIMKENYSLNCFPSVVRSVGGHYFGMVCKNNIDNSLMIDIPLLLEILKKEDREIHKIPESEYIAEKYINSGNNSVQEIIDNALSDRSGNWDGLDGKVPLILYEKDWEKINSLIDKDIKPDNEPDGGALIYFYETVASIYGDNNDFENKIKMLERALDISTKMFHVEIFNNILLNICSALEKLKRKYMPHISTPEDNAEFENKMKMLEMALDRSLKIYNTDMCNNILIHICSALSKLKRKKERKYFLEKYHAISQHIYKYPFMAYAWYKILYYGTLKKHKHYKMKYKLAKHQL